MSAPSETPTILGDITFAALLKRTRENAGWTQEELAERAGLSANAISALERGDRRHPHLPTVRALADALGLVGKARAELFAAIPGRHNRDSENGDRAVSAPVLRDPLIGRERAVSELRDLVLDPSVALVTLVGSPGVGKTRLALAIAREVAGSFPDGVFFISLASITDARQVAYAIATGMELQLRDGMAPGERIIRYLRAKRALLLLDNFEHVVAAGPLVGDILATCPDVTALVTSREVIHLSGERVYEVPTLGLPGKGADQDAATVAESAAVRLFAMRARAARADFTITDANAADVAAICSRLDGLPLAIELAAARVSVLSPSVMLRRLDHRLQTLAAGPRDAPERHKSLFGAISWSYDLLSAPEQSLFRQLAVFVGGFTLAGGESVASDGDILGGIASLVDKSLLRRIDLPDDEPRFEMLETVREFGIEQLETTGEIDGVRRNHAEHMVAIAEVFSTELAWNLDPATEHRRLSAEYGDFESALKWASSTDEDLLFCRLAVALTKFWMDSGRLSEGRSWLSRAEGKTFGRTDELRAMVLSELAWLVRCQGDGDQARKLAEKSLTLSRHNNMTLAALNAIQVLAHVAEDQGDFTRAHRLCQEGLELARPLNHPFWIGFSASQAGWTAYLCGNPERGEALIEEALRFYGQTGSRYGRALALSNLGEIARSRGQYARAAELWQERLNYPSDAWGFRWSLEGLADLAVDLGEMARAARLLGASEALRERFGIQLVPSRLPEYEASVTAARSALGDDAFNASWQEGRAMSEDDARAEAALVGRGVSTGK